MKSPKIRLIGLYQRLRIIKYKFLSDCRNVEGRPFISQPVLLLGRGRIKFHGRVNLGVFSSPFWHNGYIYIEARSEEALIEIEDGVYINNNCVIGSDGPGIFIGKNTMLGTNCEVLDTDGHDTHPDRRIDGEPKSGKVAIGENVLIGSNVKILKGVRIGNNSVISNSSVLTRSVPENTLVYGNPARGGRLVDLGTWGSRT